MLDTNKWRLMIVLTWYFHLYFSVPFVIAQLSTLLYPHLCLPGLHSWWHLLFPPSLASAATLLPFHAETLSFQSMAGILLGLKAKLDMHTTALKKPGGCKEEERKGHKAGERPKQEIYNFFLQSLGEWVSWLSLLLSGYSHTRLFDLDSVLFPPECLLDQQTGSQLHICKILLTQSALKATLLLLHSGKQRDHLAPDFPSVSTLN